MHKMRVTISSSDKENRTVKGLMSILILLSKEKRANCQLTSPTEATIEGDEDTLLEILNHIDRVRPDPVLKNVAITMEFDEYPNKSFARHEVQASGCNKAEETGSQPLPERARKDRQRIHDMVVERLTKHMKR